MNSNLFMPRRNLIFLAVLLASSAAQADVVTVNGTNVALLPAASVSTGASGTSATGPTQTSLGTLGQFNATLGVLTGAAATASFAPATPPAHLIKGGGTGSASARSTWSLGGNSSGQVTINTAGPAGDSGWQSINLTSSAANLNNFVGAGNIATNSFASYISVSRSSGGAVYAHPGTSLTAKQVLNYNESITYTYLNHSNASFTSGLDTNALTQDVSAGAFSFSAFNLGTAATTTKLDFDSYSCISGDCAAFALSPPSFEDLAAGGSGISGSVGLGTANAGVYQATYRLVFSDDEDFGATLSQRENSLTLNVNGTVAAAVPEPETYAMILSGLGFMGFLARRRKKMETA